MKNKYFKLNKDYILVIGKENKGLIYDLKNGNMIELEKTWTDVLVQLENGIKIENVKSSYTYDVIEKIKKETMGEFYDNFIYEEKTRKGMILPLEGMQKLPPIIHKCYIQMPTSCNLNCEFCFLLKSYPCFVCSKNSNVNSIDSKAYKTFLNNLLNLNVHSIIFYGGDLLSYINTENLLDICLNSEKKPEIWILLHWRHIRNNKILEKEIYKKINFYITFSASDIFDGENEKNFSLFMKTLNYMKEYTKKFELTFVQDSEEISEFKIKDMLDIIINKYKTKIYISKLLDENNKSFMNHLFMRVSPKIFWNNYYYHPCLNGTITLNAEGKILPCPSMENENALKEIFLENKIDKYWKLHLGKIEKCKNCIYRFGCFECRAIEAKTSQRLNGKSLCKKGE
ncbi:4Fe-4S cluster-binding domain-containing protein [Marinitoga hydrogenitolerans]|nr:4Fe-4S cluster-binding domain-containing protein [Marinitoga hydrogenitolerans]